jgi:prepilin peptidase CpaA
MLAEVLVLVALPLLLAAAGAYDLASFTIPNFLQAALLAAFVVFALALHLGATAIGFHLLAGLIGLTLGFALFALGYVGGGDAKLFAAVLLWLGLKDLMPYTLVATVLGGVLSLSLIALRRLPLPAMLARQAWILRLHDSKSGIPYGVALAAGVLVILPGTDIWRLAAGG